MKPFIVNGETWRVIQVHPGDPRLIDRTGVLRVATTDPATRTVCVSSDVMPPFLDRVLLHEVAHAVTISHGLLDPLHAFIPEELWILVEEWAAQLIEEYSIEAAVAAAESIGRPLCVHGHCMW